MGIFTKPPNQDINRIESFVGATDLQQRLALAAEPSGQQLFDMTNEGFQGDLSAGIAPLEQGSLDTLGGILETTTPSQTQLAGLSRDELTNTLSEDTFDPSEGQYYEAYRTAVMRELTESADRINAQSAADSNFFGGGRIQTIGESEEAGFNKINQFLGASTERERDRRLNTALGVPSFLGQQDQADFGRVAAGQTLGALPRTLEQEGNDREYEAYLNQLQALNVPLQTAIKLAQFKIPTIVTGTEERQKAWVTDFQGFSSMIGGAGAGGGGGAGAAGAAGGI